ncbi:hypothetical protein [Paenibacillus sp. YYML68]|uniref:hypothetical protein n=1 Tax=Paenibacillus sp. YYML68 TaxID=2909250 RepID=UPI00249001DC|nr:hypothetical protein [Paenibacillus sp. YYML68]
MDQLLYFILGALDVLALLTLALKAFRFPLRTYIGSLVVIAVCASLLSYTNRMVLLIPEWDLLAQLILFIVLLRLLLKVHWHEAATIATVGTLFISLISCTAYATLVALKIFDPSIANDNIGLGVHLIQITSEAACFLTCYFLHLRRYGFTSIVIPTTNKIVMHKTSALDRLITGAAVISSLLIVLGINWIMVNFYSVIIVIPSIAAALIILIRMSYQKELQQH